MKTVFTTTAFQLFAIFFLWLIVMGVIHV